MSTCCLIYAPFQTRKPTHDCNQQKNRKIRVIKTLPEFMRIKPVLMDNAVAVAAVGRGRKAERALGWLRAGLGQGEDNHSTDQVG